MSIPTPKVRAPQGKTTPPQAVSAAALLACATKKAKATNHLVYTGEAGQEAAARWLELNAQFAETKIPGLASCVGAKASGRRSTTAGRSNCCPRPPRCSSTAAGRSRRGPRPLAALGISRRSYYRWLKEEKWAKQLPEPPVRPVQPYEALPEEKEAVIAYALRHPELRHRELAWRMVDEDVVCLSPSTVYRILKEANLVCPWRRRSKRRREEDEKATRPNQIWATDLMYVQVGGATYFFVSFMDEYSRYVVHHELLLGMDGVTVSLAAQKAIDTLPKKEDGSLVEKPTIRSDNGSGYVSQEFKVVLKENGLDHQRIKPHCPEANGIIERSNRTIREHLEGEELTNLVQAQKVFARIIGRYNEERLHSALGFLRPADYYRGDPSAKYEQRRLKLAEARHRRRERNLQLQQGTLPYAAAGTVANT